MDKETKTLVADLLKYPVLVLSLLLAAGTAKYCGVLEFGPVTEMGPQGVKFAEQSRAVSKSLTDLETQVNASLVRLDALEADRKGSQISQNKQVEEKAASAAQVVSDSTAQAARIVDAMRVGQLKGYIWVGNFDRRWQPTNLARLDSGQPIELPPDQLREGTEYQVLGNMVARDGLPQNDSKYYQGRSSLGVITRGTRVMITKTPIGVERGFAVQYWAEVAVAESRGSQ